MATDALWYWFAAVGQVAAPAQPLTTAPLGYWFAFGAFVTVLLVLDLAVFHRQSKEQTLREAAGWTAVWCSLALAFNVAVYLIYRRYEIGERPFGVQPALDFFMGYLLEWSLSMDNVFVFAVIFNYFGVPMKYQYRVLFWGILGAVAMRLPFVLIGTALIEQLEAIMLLFGAFLVYTGIKMTMHGGADFDPGDNILVRLAKRWFPVAHGEHGDRFFVVEAGRRCMTPLFLVLLVVDFADLVFAVDSVPAIFGVTTDPFIVFTSNIFAILGLRALYFLLARVMDLFRFLNYGLSAILVFIGVKMVLKTTGNLLGHNWWPFPDWASLVVLVALLGASIIASLLIRPPKD